MTFKDNDFLTLVCAKPRKSGLYAQAQLEEAALEMEE